MTTVKAFAALEQGKPFETFEYELGELGPHHVDIAVTNSGLCHSDLSMLNNDWGMTQYPFVGGHEVIGKIQAVGEHVHHLKKGQTVGLGWFAGNCTTCPQCVSGKPNLCAQAEGTIVGRHGGFADTVRAEARWVSPLPDGLDLSKAGPLFCGGITVFSPFLNFDVKPTDRVAIIGLGGLGHMAVMFASKWGCEVTCLSTSSDKEAEAKQLGAHHFVNVKQDGALDKLEGSFDFILNTTNADLPWDAYVAALKPQGRLHTVGAVLSPFGTSNAFPLIMGQKSLSGSPLGSPEQVRLMLEFCARHDLAPMTETFKMDRINDAFEKLKNGSPRYRIVLEN